MTDGICLNCGGREFICEDDDIDNGHTSWCDQCDGHGTIEVENQGDVGDDF